MQIQILCYTIFCYKIVENILISGIRYLLMQRYYYLFGLRLYFLSFVGYKLVILFIRFWVSRASQMKHWWSKCVFVTKQMVPLMSLRYIFFISFSNDTDMITHFYAGLFSWEQIPCNTMSIGWNSSGLLDNGVWPRFQDCGYAGSCE